MRFCRSRCRQLSVEALESRRLLTVVMSPQEQLMIELVNRARADPLAEAERFGLDLNQDVAEDELISEDAKQPLAPHQALTDAAGLHSEDMLTRNFFGHNTPAGITPSDRARAAGYPAGAGENIAWKGETQLNRHQEVYDRHQGLFESVGHRVNMMREPWREIGAGVRYGTFTQGFVQLPSIMVGTLFGNRRGNHFLTGVVITDHIRRNNFYEMGEGVGAVTIVATREGSEETYESTTGPTGGYSIEVPQGIYTLTATGEHLNQPITVRGVEIADANVKVDFNRAGMPTRFIDGFVFQDLNGDGRRGPQEIPAGGAEVFLDYDGDGAYSQGEPLTTTTSDGTYRFTDLLPGDYDVQLVAVGQTEQTWPKAGYQVTIEMRNLVGADFGTHERDVAPQPVDDVAAVTGGESIVVRVLDNDLAGDLPVAPSSLQITSPPEHGSAEILPSGEIRYTADLRYAGADSFTYTVADTEGNVSSSSGIVQIAVRPAFPWQNPEESMDVNGDGFVVSQDVLVLIREINRTGAGTLANRRRAIDSPFYDVNGDNFISPVDVLRVIRFLNQQSAVQAAQRVQPAPPAVDQLFAVLAAESTGPAAM